MTINLANVNFDTIIDMSLLREALRKSIKLSKANPMTNNYKPVHLYFHRHYIKEYVADTIDFFTELPNLIIPCESWHELSQYLLLQPSTICVHVDELSHSSAIEIVNMVNTLGKLVGLGYEVTITIAVNKNTPYNIIKQLQKTGIFGIVPVHKDFSWEETLKGLRTQWANISYWPKHILEQLPGYPQPSNRSQLLRKDTFTIRQQQIISLIQTRGLSNKALAQTLNISESAVKAQLTEVYRKTGVRSRAQLMASSTKV